MNALALLFIVTVWPSHNYWFWSKTSFGNIT